MANLTYTVQIDWDNNGTWTDANEDVTSNVLRMEWRRGKDHPHYLAGQTRPGSARIVLNNNTDIYSPLNTSSALSGNLKPGRKVRIRTQGSGSEATRWQGFIRSIIPNVESGRLKTVTITCVGALGYIGDREVEIAMQTSYRVDQAITAILDEIGWAAGDRDLNTAKTSMNRWWVDRMTVAEALRILEETEGGLIYETKDGKIAFRHRHDRTTSRTSQATFSDAAGAALTYQGIRQADPARSIYNILETEVQLFSVGGAATLWAYPDSTAPFLAVGENRDFWARYPVNDSPSEDVGVDAWTTPVENIDYDANSVAAGGGTDLSSSLTVTATKYGEAMKINISNGHATLGAFLVDSGGTIKLQARGTPVSASDPIPVRQEDTTSQGDHGERTFEARDLWIPSYLEADEWARVNLDLYKDPTPSISITVMGNRSSATLDEVEGRDINERITVRADGNAGLGFNQAWFIEGEHHVVNNVFEHRVTWDLSSVTGYDLYWKLDDNQLGTSTKLARRG